jgi:L-lactate dehydrogenase (cytochrome)
MEKNPQINKDENLNEYTKEEVAKHNSLPSIWTIFNGYIYDITEYVDKHPGGKRILEQIYGKDMTYMYNKFHPHIKINNFLGDKIIGKIKVDETVLGKNSVLQKKPKIIMNNMNYMNRNGINTNIMGDKYKNKLNYIFEDNNK